MSSPSDPDAQLVREHQDTLLVAAERFFGGSQIPKAIRRAFLDTPRHAFVHRFYSSKRREWIDLSKTPLREHLPELYADHPLCIHRSQEGTTLSTISQPSLVLYMLDLLDLQPGHRVVEVGGGSGWNAALMGQLVGPTGKIVSFEIVESLVPHAQSSADQLGLPQVEFRSGDAIAGLSNEERFDRGTFTASAWELPQRFFDQIKDHGLLLFVLKAQPSYDLLCLLRKTSPSSFESQLHFTCSFVPVTGCKALPDQEPIRLDSPELPPPLELAWSDIKIPNTALPDFLEFAKLVFDCQRSYLHPNPRADFDEEFWGFSNDEPWSLLVFNEDRLLLYGDEDCLVRLRRAAKRWQKAGCPNVETLKLSIHKSDTAPISTNDQWLARRGNTALLWGL